MADKTRITGAKGEHVDVIDINGVKALAMSVLQSVSTGGDASAANQASIIAALNSILSDLTNGTQVVGVNNFPATQAISGTVSVGNLPATQPISATALPLPTGAASSTNQTSGAAKTQIVDASGNVISSTSNSLNANVTNFPATQPVSGTVTANAGTGTFNVSAASLPLPSGAATEATLGTQSSAGIGAKSSIGTSAVQMTTTSFATKKGVLVKAASTNTGLVYVGISSGVTAGTTDSTDGYELVAGESVTIEASNQNLIYLIASASGQKVYFVAV